MFIRTMVKSSECSIITLHHIIWSGANVVVWEESLQS